MKIFNWQPGRQKGCDYLKFPLWFFKLWKLGTDAYILKYNQNSILNPHIDPVGNGKHYRLNIGWGFEPLTIKLDKFRQNCKIL